MRICYLDAFSGISGDMTVGALLDAGACQQELFAGLASLKTRATFEAERTKRRGIAATKFRVLGGEQKKHRHLPHILEMIRGAEIPDAAKAKAASVFPAAGRGRSAGPRYRIEKVHFHEVGAVDSICDIAGACMGFDLLGIDEILLRRDQRRKRDGQYGARRSACARTGDRSP